jgi:membrane protein implicated in regulation of membrane protease activity
VTEAWKLWLWASAFLAAGELLVLGKLTRMFYLGCLALGAVAAAVVAAGDVHWGIQIAVFAAASAVAIALLRPVVHRYMEADATRQGDNGGGGEDPPL